MDKDSGLQLELLELRSMSPGRAAVLWLASDHPGECRCRLCLDWWRIMGPDPANGKHGPFSVEEVNAVDAVPMESLYLPSAAQKS